jgi:hypothetical protein
MEYRIYNSNELYHHGIRGMKWGVRRFQNKDGSLTAAGEKRRAKLESELKQLKGNKKRGTNTKSETAQAPRKKTVSEMTDDELRKKTERMRVEKEYYDAARNLAQANPVKVSKGKRFMNSLMNEVVAPAAKSAGQAWLEKFMKNKLGLNEKDPVKRLEDQAKKYKAMKEIEEYKKTIKKIRDDTDDEYPEVKSWDDLQKRYQYFEKLEERRKKAEKGDD